MTLSRLLTKGPKQQLLPTKICKEETNNNYYRYL